MLLAAGCAGESPDTATASGSGTVDPSAMTDAQARPAQVVVDVTIEGGQVTPTNAHLQAGVNEPIVLRVASDVTDELHVHSTPEHSFDVGIGPAQSFQFTVEVPGRVDIELHKLHKTIATIQVQ
ncbi:hypothetical protein [Mycolicibacterium austroafricanum]|uniref:hypothetical protein n=1 Tax=Mycolicibacterium austroafricanum TaxID=39687 RepID=UPI001CA34DF8|nr:hypothetical protein [Mycolicibacterium austroafricanum]QZT62687.1 hypothetical protein JN085_28215 [Mycolicibacterium austroafricanum]